MIHEHSDVTGTITVGFEAEDWVWLCNLLSLILKEPGNDEYGREDAKHLLDALEAAEAGTAVSDLAATNSGATTSPANPQGGAEQELRQELAEIIYGPVQTRKNLKAGVYMPDVEAAITLFTKHTAVAYTQGYDDCLKEHGAVFKGEEK